LLASRASAIIVLTSKNRLNVPLLRHAASSEYIHKTDLCEYELIWET
jgi:hypothetical protein